MSLEGSANRVLFFWPVLLACHFFLAVAGAGSLLQIFANSMGWRAEESKLRVQEIERAVEL